jgi:DNA-directed RNA polymerase specialized sigma subunit
MAREKARNGRLSAEETLELWRKYKQTGDQRVRDRLVLTFAPMVKVHRVPQGARDTRPL